MSDYKIIYGDKEDVYSDEIIEKKSRFIAYIKKVETEQEAVEFINSIKKKHYDATHNCSAFVIGKNKEFMRSNDDGEPSSTAGKPMLDVLLGSGIVNIAAVVTRYFGKIKLGQGGLCRAYTDATKAGLAKCQVATMSLGKRVRIKTDYSTIGKIQREIEQRGLGQEHSEYTDVIILTIIIPVNEVDELKDKIVELSAGKSQIEVVDEVYFEKREEV
ncbi:MAG: YigZ family protein [Eubacteriales bacterium]